MLKLSVLDQSTGAAGRAEDEALRQSIDLAQACEAVGYHRYWVSEHHNHPSILGTAPEILMAAIAAQTSRIRVGSAGVMLPHYSAFKVAEQFRVLDAIAPGRIDLGVGRAPGSDGHTAYALNPYADHREDGFPAQLRDLLFWVNGLDLPEGHPFRGIVAHPQSPSAPELWVLGSSNYGAQLAAHFGLPYAFAHFITDGRGCFEALDIYRAGFRPSRWLSEPQATVCVWALAAETETEARLLFRSRARWRLDRNRGRLQPVQAPPAIPEFSADEMAETEALWQRSFAGEAKDVLDRLSGFAHRAGVDELVILTWTHDPAAKRRSYELLAQAAGFSGDQSISGSSG